MSEANYEPIDIHLKRIETSRTAWLGVIAKANYDINYHGNIVSSLGHKNRDENQQLRYEASWSEISRANTRLKQAEYRLQVLIQEEKELLELCSISKAKEFMRQINNNQAWNLDNY